MADKIFLTQAWLEKLKAELESLKTVKRVEIAEKLKEAISFWDLSENSEYEDARNEQAQVELRISDLEEQLKNVEIISEDNKAEWKVHMWSIVEIENIDTKEKDNLKIVGSTEADIFSEPKNISNDSPLGKALLWKKKWVKIKVKSMWGTYEYKITNVE